MKHNLLLKKDYNLQQTEISSMVYMSAYYVHAAQQAVHLFGGILTNLSAQLLCYRPIDSLLIQETQKLLNGLRVFLIHSAFTDAMEL
jgi:hypothetical protein